MTLSRYHGDPDFLRGLRALRSVTAADDAAVLHRTAMLLLSPSALRAHRVAAALQWLEGHDFSIEFARVIQLNAEHIRRIWKYQIVNHDRTRIRIFADAMTCGPALLLAVVARPGGVGPAAERLRGLKGPADPRRAEAHHLRTHLGAGNTFNNLVHTCDGPAEVVRESAVMLDDLELADLWRRMSDALSDPRGQGRIAAMSATPATCLPGGVSLVHIAVPLRRRLLAEPHGIAQRPWQDRIGVLGRQVSAEARWVAQQDPYRTVATLAAFRRHFRPLRAQLAAAVSTPSANRVAQLAALFGEVDNALFTDRFDLDRMAEAAAAADFDLDAHTRIVFSTEWLARSLTPAPPVAQDLSTSTTAHPGSRRPPALSRSAAGALTQASQSPPQGGWKADPVTR